MPDDIEAKIYKLHVFMDSVEIVEYPHESKKLNRQSSV